MVSVHPISSPHQRTQFAVLLLLLVWSFHAAAQRPEPAGEAQIQRLTEQFDVKQDQKIRIVNRFGNVRIREVPLNSLAELAVTVQLESGVENPVRTRVELDSDGVLEVGVASDVALEEQAGLLRMDMTVGLPDRVDLEVELEQGDFTMHAASYPVRLRARNGSARIRTSGPVDIDVAAGHVVYLPPRGVPVAGGRIQTSRAPVDILMNDPQALSFEVLSGAAITTDSLALLQRREIDGRTHRFQSRAADGTLRIQTDEAPVRLVFEGIR